MKNKNWTQKTLKRSHSFYKNCVDRFSSQYKDIAVMNRVFINANDKVFAAEWVDSKGVFNIIGGIYPDIVKTVEFTD